MDKETIFTETAPSPVGPYSQAVRAGGWLYLSGQLPIAPETNQVISGTIEEQTELAFNNAKKVLEAAGASLENVVKVTLYLANMDDFAKVNEVYSGFFQIKPPARCAIEAARLPKDVSLEVDMVAYLGE